MLCDVDVAYDPIAVRMARTTVSLTVEVPPTMTTRFGLRRFSSAATLTGRLVGDTSSTGPRSRPATGAAASASGNVLAVAMYTTPATPALWLARLMASAVA
jgi:hypothetical protein